MSSRSREIRLGVVMFGGVSLAVYINGVSQELFRAVRGRGVYRLLKALTDSEVVVDILSGASAGGINSVLLSAALCNQTDFGSTAGLWRTDADIERLLSPSGELSAAERRAPPKDSLLDGAFLHERLRTAIAKLLAPPALVAEPEDVSQVPELDLFVTATDIDGQQRRWFDALSHPIQLLDHRTLFRLKHRDSRNTPFAASAAGDGSESADPGVGEANLEALTTLSHITSCFPGAFEPVRVVIPARDAVGPKEQFSTTIEAVNARLKYWGRLFPFEDAEGQVSAREALFMDGGVLKNKPFTSTIEAIFSRLADRQVSRYLLYVDPDPGSASIRHPVHPEAFDPASRLLPVAFAAASGLPRFESIDADLAQVELHNQQVRRYEAVVKHATAAALANPAALPGPETASARAYRRARLAGLAAAVVDSASSKRSLAFNAPGQRPARPDLSALIDVVCQSPRASELFAQFDVLFGFRRLIQLSYTVDDHARVELADRKRIWATLPTPDAIHVERFQIDSGLLEAINRQIEFYEVLRARLETELGPFVQKSEADWGSQQFWLDLADHARAVLRRLPRPSCFAGTATGVAADMVRPEELTELRGTRQSLGELPRAEHAGSGEDFLRAAQAFEQRLIDQPNLRKLYDCFPQIDEVAYPLELSSELRGRDQVRTVRVSTLDSTRGFAKQFTKKLCGRQLGGFSGFFKASWRANDLMWGRIDGASQLLDLLLDTKRLSQLAPELLQSNLQKVLGEAFDLSGVFPHSSAADRQLLQAWLFSLCRAETAAAALESLDGPLLRECWARAVQLEIVVEELPVVLKLAQCEDAPASHKAALATQQKAFQSSSPLQVGASAAAYFNPAQYRVGEESLPSAIEPARLSAIASEGGRHLKDALLVSLPDATFGQHLIRGLANAILGAALRLLTGLWLRGKLGER